MRILITGASGYLGRNLSSKLTDDNYEIIGIDRFEPNQPFAGEFIKIDFSLQADELTNLMKHKQIDTVIHCGSIHPNKQYSDEEYISCNIQGCWNVIKAADEAGIKKIIHTSSVAATGHYVQVDVHSWPIAEDYRFDYPVDMYCLTKQTQEEICKHFAYIQNIKIIGLRASGFVYRELDRVEAAMKFLHCGIWIDDLVDIHIRAIEKIEGFGAGFYPYWACSELPIRKEDWYDAVEDTDSVVKKYWPAFYECVRKEDKNFPPPTVIYDLSRSVKELGWKPKMNFDKWIKKFF